MMKSCCPDSAPPAAQPTCRGSASEASSADVPSDASWIVDWLETPAGRVPRVATELSRADRLGAVKVRLDIRRMGYAVESGLYAVGDATPDSPVLVSANYKLSFDRLRQELGGLDAWILVLDTKGINVWCAAGKGTFGTDELVHRVAVTELAKVVSHRNMIVPQLGAPGVAAHEVKKRSKFRVVYGPVRARDIPAFLEAGMQATPEMRLVRFELTDRLAVVPTEFVQAGRWAVLVMAVMFLLGGLHRGGYDSALAVADGGRAAILVLAAFLGGCVLAPALLPWLPGRAFSIKGALVGLLPACIIVVIGWLPLDGIGGWLEAVAWVLLVPAASGFLAMNFTGASTYTSLSGVKREMRVAVPAQIAATAIGLAFWVTARFF
jgi:acetyl-CoA decarbonylase/synthase complex subunit gamma